MCYSVYLSTTSIVDFSRENSDLLHFCKIAADDPLRSLLLYNNQWYVGSKSGCSCTFRHLSSVDLGFGEPVEWYPEDGDEIAATLLFVSVVRRIIKQGYKVDCIDAWYGTTKKDIQVTKVNLDEIRDDQFRFFENHHLYFHLSQ